MTSPGHQEWRTTPQKLTQWTLRLTKHRQFLLAIRISDPSLYRRIGSLYCFPAISRLADAPRQARTTSYMVSMRPKWGATALKELPSPMSSLILSPLDHSAMNVQRAYLLVPPTSESELPLQAKWSFSKTGLQVAKRAVSRLINVLARRTPPHKHQKPASEAHDFHEPGYDGGAVDKVQEQSDRITDKVACITLLLS
jgi:hypothetical protein